MDFAFTDDQVAFRATLRGWIAENLPPEMADGSLAQLGDGKSTDPRRSGERKVYEAGYGAVHWPREFGGQGLTIFHHLIVNEEMGRAGAPETFNTSGVETAGPLLMAVGTPEQKSEHLARIASVDEIWCQGF